ncbi:hypothetical protein KMP13_02330 [Epibacterium ulvae]|uniref:phage adaptor protein n=1 Tax=Epibacterium ulvae TaxID=1156985 RepID=UPI001BFCA79B|nr:hypothetical protein [Epibacterium ulvae]MBT8152751.1 hypothetical protein [Epibacterium ulvae]
MSAETVLQSVLLEVGLDIPGAQITSADYQVRQVVAFMNDAGEDIARRTEWSRLYIDWEVPGGVSAVDLPDDFQEMAEQGAVCLIGVPYTPVRSVIAPEQWDFLVARPSAQPYYHLRGGQLRFSPELPADGARVRYVSRQWVNGRDRIAANADTLKIPERLVQKGAVWRWKRQKGLNYDDASAEFEADLLTEVKADRGQA